MVVAPNGTELPQLAPSDSKPSRIILFVSRIHPKKGLLDLVAAWNAIRLAGWQIRIVGPGEPEHISEIQCAIDRVGIGQVMKICPPVSAGEKWEEYRAADVFVLPSYSENFGIVVAEALASGVPVITTTATPWELLEKHACGWWIPTGAAALEKALRKATGISDAERSSMGQRGRQLVEDNFTWSAIAKSMLPHYQRLLR